MVSIWDSVHLGWFPFGQLFGYRGRAEQGQSFALNRIGAGVANKVVTSQLSFLKNEASLSEGERSITFLKLGAMSREEIKTLEDEQKRNPKIQIPHVV